MVRVRVKIGLVRFVSRFSVVARGMSGRSRDVYPILAMKQFALFASMWELKNDAVF